MPQAPQQPSDDSPVTLDTIYQGLGLSDDSTHQPTDDQLDPTDSDGAPSGEAHSPQSTEDTEPQRAGTPEAPPLQPTDDDAAALRLRHEQLTRTYIPAVERERDRALSEVENLRQHVSGLQQFQQNLTSHGLTPDEATIGLQMAAAYKANPTAFITNIIRNAQANGVEVPSGTPTPGLDVNTLSRIIDQRLAPLLAPIQAQRQEQEAQGQLRNHISTFYSQFPDAQIHEQSLATFINHQTSLGLQTSLQQAYIELYKWAVGNGYDWNQPLPAQVMSRRNSNPRQPNLGTRRTINGGSVMQNPTQFDPNASWKQIVAEAVAESGG
jgi:hypothetical protein